MSCNGTNDMDHTCTCRTTPTCPCSLATTSPLPTSQTMTYITNAQQKQQQTTKGSHSGVNKGTGSVCTPLLVRANNPPRFWHRPRPQPRHSLPRSTARAKEMHQNVASLHHASHKDSHGQQQQTHANNKHVC